MASISGPPTQTVLDFTAATVDEDGAGDNQNFEICKSREPCSGQITITSIITAFKQASCPSCCPTNSVKALKK